MSPGPKRQRCEGRNLCNIAPDSDHLLQHDITPLNSTLACKVGAAEARVACGRRPYWIWKQSQPHALGYKGESWVIPGINMRGRLKSQRYTCFVFGAKLVSTESASASSHPPPPPRSPAQIRARLLLLPNRCSASPGTLNYVTINPALANSWCN